MELSGYSVSISGGTERLNGYVEMEHGKNYSVVMGNFTDKRCDAELSIDGIIMGVFRIDSNEILEVNRPCNDFGIFTFYIFGTTEGNYAKLENDFNSGLIKVIFYPEYEEPYTITVQFQTDDSCFEEDSIFESGGTGLSGRSDLIYTNAEPIIRDTDNTVTISLRLIGRKTLIRPLPGKKSGPISTPVPPNISLSYPRKSG